MENTKNDQEKSEKNKSKKIYFSLGILLFIGITAIGRNFTNLRTNESANYSIAKTKTNRMRQKSNSDNYSNNNYSNNYSEEYETKLNSVKKRSLIITKTVEQIHEVEDAYVVISGKTAIVGVNLMDGFNDSQLIPLKKMIEEEVKTVDPEIENVAVTASAELVDRLIDMLGNDKNNDPNLKDDDSYFYRLTPTV